ncbi:hypothetical protein SKAU_G00160390 [Synaphobranchus kaupii]|uniref:Uncharacterized protein n=1 Tax=Synaphobranchus kaupii TaxID=118154 RepID=A0A9Q1FIU2_SYNKA|nr:hypothetical protein SKAU_G00160390 [Synaphobranchus kaupii]
MCGAGGGQLLPQRPQAHVQPSKQGPEPESAVCSSLKEDAFSTAGALPGEGRGRTAPPVFVSRRLISLDWMTSTWP